MAKKARTPKPPRPAQSSERRVQAPRRRSGPSRTAAPGLLDNRRYRLLGALAALLVTGGIVGAVVAATSGGQSKPTKLALTTPISWRDLPGLQTSKPPWSNDSGSLGARLGGLGLNSLSREALAFHIHAHLDVFVDGRKVAVPRFIGFHVDQQTRQASFVTELHTHYSDGIIHVESAQHLDYVLGQFMAEWGVRLTPKCLGSFSGSCDKLQWWVNGKKQTGNPAKLVLKNHEQIAISIGKPPASIPKSFDFGSHGV